jgi:hypothetical protein
MSQFFRAGRVWQAEQFILWSTRIKEREHTGKEQDRIESPVTNSSDLLPNWTLPPTFQHLQIIPSYYKSIHKVRAP